MAGWATKIEGTTISPSFHYIPGVNFASQVIRQPWAWWARSSRGISRW
jgi:phenylacetaldehyde dehydrogenase